MVCLWCERPFRGRVSGGKAQRFCSPEHRAAFHRAARQWAIGAVEAGIVTVDCLKNTVLATYTLVSREKEGRVDPGHRNGVTSRPAPPCTGQRVRATDGDRK